MEWEKIAEKIRDTILGEIKDEFREFRASVTGELSGFRLAIESINARQGNMENELRDIRRSIDETNKRIDETRVELKAEIMQNTLRIDEVNKRIDEVNKRIDEVNKRVDETNKRIDALFLEIAEIRGDVKKAISDKEIIHDILFRIERLETKAAA
jgi:chromosome segregation ATPase